MSRLRLALAFAILIQYVYSQQVYYVKTESVGHLCTLEQPCSNIQQALKNYMNDPVYNPVFTVYVAPGEYSGEENVGLSFPERTEISKWKQPGEADRTAAAAAAVVFDGANNSIKIENCFSQSAIQNSLFIMDSISIQNCRNAIYLNCKNIQLNSVTIGNNSSASFTNNVILNYVETSSIINSTFYGQIAIQAGYTPPKVTISNSIFVDIPVSLSGCNVHIDGCTFNGATVNIMANTNNSSFVSNSCFTSCETNYANFTITQGNVTLSNLHFDNSHSLYGGRIAIQTYLSTYVSGRNLTSINGGFSFPSSDYVTLDNITMVNSSAGIYFSSQYLAKITDFSLSGSNSSIIVSPQCDSVPTLEVELSGGVLHNSGAITVTQAVHSGEITDVQIEGDEHLATIFVSGGVWNISNIEYSPSDKATPVPYALFTFDDQRTTTSYGVFTVHFQAIDLSYFHVATELLFLNSAVIDVVFYDCVFSNNQHFGNNDRNVIIHSQQAKKIVVEECQFLYNAVGALYAEYSPIVITSSEFRGNNVSGYHVVYIESSAELSYIDQCSFENNGYASGVVTFVNSHPAIVSNSSFVNNRNPVTSTQGGALHLYNTDSDITGCTFINNTATHGGALYMNVVSTSPSNITSSMFLSNIGSAVYIADDMGTMIVNLQQLTFNNNIEYAIECDATSNVVLQFSSMDTVSINHNNTDVSEAIRNCLIVGGPPSSASTSFWVVVKTLLAIVVVIIVAVLFMICIIVCCSACAAYCCKKKRSRSNPEHQPINAHVITV